MSGEGKVRVAILGGGVGAMVAACELTHPSQNDRYDVTVYQLGWRLGGKGASGRNQKKGLRIEEHGIHIWFGCYDNSFRLMRAVYDELGRGPTDPLATWDEGFKPENYVSLYQQFQGDWTPWTFEFPIDGETPGSRTHLPTMWDYLKRILEWIPELLKPHHAEHFPNEKLAEYHEKPHWWDKLISDHKIHLTESHLTHAFGLPHVLAALSKSTAHDDADTHSKIAGLLAHLKKMLWKAIEHKVEGDLELLRMWIMFDLGATFAIGVIADGLLVKPVTSINHLDFKEWLSQNGGTDVAVNSPLIDALYEMIFGFVDGVSEGPDATGSIEAGTIAKAMPYIVLGYSGAFIWKMQAGMGDVVFGPMYQLLKRRGVKFKFFHRVTNLHVENGELASIDISRQVNLNGGEYQPLLMVKGLPCWPSEPLYEQIVEGDTLRDQNINLESFYTTWQDTGGDLTLKAGEDYDVAVLGISVGAMPYIATELGDASSDWRTMVEKVGTVQTQALQVWMNEPPHELGVNIPPGTLFGNIAPSPLDSGAEMNQLIEREAWHTEQTFNITYFAGSLAGPPVALPPDHHDAPQKALETVAQNSVDLLNNDAGIIWKDATTPEGFDWATLIAPQSAPGAARLKDQYVRANIAPTERYVQSLKGSSKHRLPPGASGFKRLVLAGDWTLSSVNMGSVEGATVSGMLASRAISGYPQHIVGVEADSPEARVDEPLIPDTTFIEEQTMKPRTGGDKPTLTYIKHGAEVSGPAPVVCDQGVLWGFILKGTQSNLDAFLKRIFYEPTGGQAHYVPLGEHIMVTFGRIGKAFSDSAPFGWVPEDQTVFWIPALEVHQRGNKLVAEKLALFPAYTYVHNPFSLASGREVYGFFKGWGWTGLPDDLNPPNPAELGLDVFGLKEFGTNVSPQRLPLIKATRRGAGTTEGNVVWNSVKEAKQDLAHLLFSNVDQEKIVPGIDLAFSLLHDLVDFSIPLIFFKQIRDSLEPLGACYQAVTESKAKTTAFRGVRLIDTYDVTLLNDLESDPVQQDFGIQSQQAAISFRMELDFVLEPTAVHWSASNAG